MKWKKEEIDLSVNLIKDGKTFLEIANILNRTQNSVTKKLNRLGYKSGYNKKVEIKYLECGKKIEIKYCKYSEYDWDKFQKEYDTGFSYKDLIKNTNLTPHAIMWAKDNGKLTLRSVSDGMKLAWERGKFKKSDKKGLERYRQLCRFKFKLSDFPDEFKFDIIEEFGWYKAKNRGDNPNGVSRDHMYSISEGFKNKVDPYYISHPVNCRLMRHKDNNKKNGKCSITLDNLMERVIQWDKRMKRIRTNERN